MKRFSLLSVLAAAWLSIACAGGSVSLDDVAQAGQELLGQNGPLSNDEITRGLKEALSKGSTAVVAQLGARDGFAKDPAIKVPLPDTLRKARDFASKVGLEGSFDDLELRLNRAAEQAAPKAKSLFLGAIKSMTLEDAGGILKGPDDAATQYFQRKTGASLKSSMRPLVDDALAQVGAVNAFNKLLREYNSIPLAPKVEADLTGHVVDEGAEGIFYYLAREEQAIRNDPLKRTSQLLQRVFGSQ
ncbi:MAG: DUF4197 domain-containing protein [Gammaproteobacteria bacterium]|nr:DUF4197 domain-containing protein [Gammaproteobacteria bacterium]